MSAKLAHEIRKQNPFDAAEQEAFLNLQKTADALAADMADVLRPSGLSPTQYNVLRILRGVGSYGLPLGEIGQRMITRDPDLTRLVDRLEKRKLVARNRCDKDRRRVYGRITDDGLTLLASLDAVVLDAHRRQLGHLGPERLQQLIALLEDARARVCDGRHDEDPDAPCTGASGG
ncbi:MAG TPA: MarR family transcriptional regulator [Tepidisphaeraceae bacterium]|nr:MarR family transcriptional regulator [Tepidisphaeraceae bacterium]